MIIKYEVKNPKIKDAIKNKLFPNKKWESLKKNPPPFKFDFNIDKSKLKIIKTKIEKIIIKS